MSKFAKFTLITALVLIVLGLCLAAVSWSLGGADWSELDGIHAQVAEKPLEEAFSSVYIADTFCDVYVEPSMDDSASVSYTDSDLSVHTVTVKDGVLNILTEETGTWKDRLFLFQTTQLSVKLYLPQKVYDSIVIQTTSGNIFLGDIGVTMADLSSTSGDILSYASPADQLNLNATSGSITAFGTASTFLNAAVTSGDIHLSGFRCEFLSAQSTSGEMELTDVLASGDILLSASSGDIDLHWVDSETATITTTSGDIEGSILSSKQFMTETSSGELRVPASDSNATVWNICTSSGDVELELAQ